MRQAAQRILAKHLQPGPAPTTPVETFWRNIDLDLDNATLVEWDLKHCHVHEATFNWTRFVGYTTFEGAQFTRAWFDRARFTGYTTFEGAQFTNAWFDRARFTGNTTTFEGAQFTNAWFDGARFEQRVPAEILVWPGPWRVRDDADGSAEPPSDNRPDGRAEQ